MTGQHAMPNTPRTDPATEPRPIPVVSLGTFRRFVIAVCLMAVIVAWVIFEIFAIIAANHKTRVDEQNRTDSEISALILCILEAHEPGDIRSCLTDFVRTHPGTVNVPPNLLPSPSTPSSSHSKSGTPGSVGLGRSTPTNVVRLPPLPLPSSSRSTTTARPSPVRSTSPSPSSSNAKPPPKPAPTPTPIIRICPSPVLPVIPAGCITLG